MIFNFKIIFLRIFKFYEKRLKKIKQIFNFNKSSKILTLNLNFFNVSIWLKFLNFPPQASLHQMNHLQQTHNVLQLISTTRIMLRFQIETINSNPLKLKPQTNENTSLYAQYEAANTKCTYSSTLMYRNVRSATFIVKQWRAVNFRSLSAQHQN